MRPSLLLAVFLAGCPEPDTCAGAPTSADVSIDIVADAVTDVVPEGGPIPYEVGLQGSSMAVFRVAYSGDGVDGCIRRTLIATDRDGWALLSRSSAIALDLEDGVWVEPELQIIGPGGEINLEVEAYGTTLARTVRPSAEPSPASFTGPTSGTAGTPIDLVLGFESVAPRTLSVEVIVEPPSAVVEPAILELPYNATEVPLRVTAAEPGAVIVTARTSGYGGREAQTMLTIE